MKSSWNLTNEDLLDWSSPLSPCDDDIKNYDCHLSKALTSSEYHTQFILGVTPQLYKLGNSYNLNVFAIDSSERMLENIWPGLKENALHSNWLDLRRLVKDPSIISSDGGLHLLTFEEQRVLVKSFKERDLSNSNFIFRIFLPNEFGLSSAQIFELLFDGGISNADELKFLLWSAVDLNENGQVRVSEIWNSLFRICKGDIMQTLKSIGFTKSTIRTLFFYRDNDSVYSFAKLRDIEELFLESASLKLTEISYPNYRFGEFFPVVSFKKEVPS
jgi:hypothetical protein